MKIQNKPELIKQNRMLKRIIANKENSGKNIGKQILETYVETINSILEQHSIQLQGRIAISGASDMIDEKNYYIGAKEQLDNVKKVVNSIYDISIKSLNETVVNK